MNINIPRILLYFGYCFMILTFNILNSMRHGKERDKMRDDMMHE